MFNIVALLLVITPIFVYSQLRISGGREVLDGSVPYQVSLRHTNNGHHFCGGSVITAQAVLTAAHCVKSMKPELLKVVVGTNQLNASGQSYRVKKIVSHENYHFPVNDIAILFTEEEIQFTDRVKAVQLNDEPLKAGEKLLVTGWGLTSFNGQQPNDLMELVVNMVSYEDCRKALKDFTPVYRTQICGLAQVGQGTCKGDSGGPLVALDGLKQVGIVSLGLPCATGKPDIYTNVHSYLPWIENTLYDDDPSSSSSEEDDDYYIYFNSRFY